MGFNPISDRADLEGITYMSLVARTERTFLQFASGEITEQEARIRLRSYGFLDREITAEFEWRKLK